MKQEDIKRDQYIKSLIKESGLERTPHDFTQKVMRKIRHESQPYAFAYKPLISRKAWVTMAFAGIAMLILIITTYSAGTPAQASPEIELNLYVMKFTGFFTKIDLPFLSSPVSLMAVGAFLILLFADLLFNAGKWKPSFPNE